jgi:hypothetical protein
MLPSEWYCVCSLQRQHTHPYPEAAQSVQRGPLRQQALEQTVPQSHTVPKERGSVAVSLIQPNGLPSLLAAAEPFPGKEHSCT